MGTWSSRSPSSSFTSKNKALSPPLEDSHFGKQFIRVLPGEPSPVQVSPPDSFLETPNCLFSSVLGEKRMCLVLSVGPMGGAAPEFCLLTPPSPSLVVTRWAERRGKMLAQLNAISQSLGCDFPLLGRAVSNGGMDRHLRLSSIALSASGLYQVCMRVRD